MPRTLSSVNQAGVAAAATEPVWLVDFGFTSTLRLSSRQDITWNGNTYTSADLEVSRRGNQASIRLYNDQLTYGATFISEGTAGKTVTVRQVYGAGASFSPGDADVWFDGELGAARVSTYITVDLRPHAPVFSPRLIAADDIFSHLPPDGTEISTPSGTFILKRRN